MIVGIRLQYGGHVRRTWPLCGSCEAAKPSSPVRADRWFARGDVGYAEPPPYLVFKCHGCLLQIRTAKPVQAGARS